MADRRYPWLWDKAHRRRGLADLRRAVELGWPIPAADRAAFVEELAALLDSPDLSPREAVAVAGVFHAMERANAGAG